MDFDSDLFPVFADIADLVGEDGPVFEGNSLGDFGHVFFR